MFTFIEGPNVIKYKFTNTLYTAAKWDMCSEHRCFICRGRNRVETNKITRNMQNSRVVAVRKDTFYFSFVSEEATMAGLKLGTYSRIRIGFLVFASVAQSSPMAVLPTGSAKCFSVTWWRGWMLDGGRFRWPGFSGPRNPFNVMHAPLRFFFHCSAIWKEFHWKIDARNGSLGPEKP